MATSPQLRSLPALAERRQASPERNLTTPETGLTLAEPPAGPASLVAALRDSKELVFILVGIALAFTIHFGFGDFVRTESSTPKVPSPLAADEVGNSARVRAAAFERAGQRARRQRAARRESAQRAAAAARAAASRPAPRTVAPSAQTPTRSVSPSPAPARAPAPAPAPSKPKPSPARNGGGGGQSFDDSG